MGGCGAIERIDFLQFLLTEGVMVLKEPIFNSFYLRKDVVFLKELISYSFYYGKVWWS